MRDVVHEFVSECQKGFYRPTFTKMRRTGKEYYYSWTWKKPLDRVSYEFTMKGLEALGFGNKFRS
jgi:hypothetical protein